MEKKKIDSIKAGWEQCTDTEKKICQLIAQGLSSPKIAEKVSTKKEPITFRGVENRVLQLTNFFGAKGKTNLTAKLVAAGVIEVK